MSKKHFTNLQFLAMAMLADFIPGPKISILEEAFSKNLLGTFLLVRKITFEIASTDIHTFILNLKVIIMFAHVTMQANFMTGLVNLSIDTIYVSTVPALVILSIYSSILSAAVVIAEFYGFKLKFW